jgi:hypothetical protein
MQGPQEEPLIHFDEGQVPAPAPEVMERSGGPRTVEQVRHVEACPAQQPGEQVTNAEMDRQEEDRGNSCQPENAVRNSLRVDREKEDGYRARCHSRPGRGEASGIDDLRRPAFAKYIGDDIGPCEQERRQPNTKRWAGDIFERVQVQFQYAPRTTARQDIF